ncbi:hypothetical protein [Adhaeribacter rhizoryzae]|uniref:Uncharacterized protein n=1 Tax=Adhaeribacter rhizoryzae TaxID=2607907 RepID=A0A5M6DJ21_9BACT|nr:hypothetical protein [Adhaeribacter rhizoryzae]KAA5547481.1 hypothetical protein F0145_09150 [Adhaeribacter rhizoryzae]
MKLPENYLDLTCILLSHLLTEPAPHNNLALRQQLTEKIKAEDFGELIAYALKQNLIYINNMPGSKAYLLTTSGKSFIQKNTAAR